MAIKYRVKMMESERGWGKSYWNADFDTFEEAKEYMARVVKDNADEYARTRTVPDYYIQTASDKIEAVEV